jgi:hypothetical protein
MSSRISRQLAFRAAAVIVAAMPALALSQLPTAYAGDPHNGKPCENTTFVGAHPKYCKKLKRAHPVQPRRPDAVRAVGAEIEAGR